MQLKKLPAPRPRELAKAVADAKPVEYELLWRNKFLAINAQNFDQFLAMMESAVNRLKAMKADGVHLRKEGITHDYATFWTTSPVIAKKYGMEKPPWEEDEEG